MGYLSFADGMNCGALRRWANHIGFGFLFSTVAVGTPCVPGMWLALACPCLRVGHYGESGGSVALPLPWLNVIRIRRGTGPLESD